MYAPIEYCKQVENYFIILGENAEEVESKINEDTQAFVKSFLNTNENRKDLWYDYAKYAIRVEKIGKFPKVIADKYKPVMEGIQRTSRIATMGLFDTETPYDIFNYLYTTSICDYWINTKFAYRIEPTLAKMLINVESDPEVAFECFSHQPSSVYYIDTSSLEGYLCKGMEGFFVACILHKGSLVMNYMPLIRGENDRLIPIFSSFCCEIDGRGISFEYEGENTVNITLEDGITRSFKQKETVWLFLNMILYLQAQNRDVEKNETTRKYEKKGIKVSNKHSYKEVTQYDVGYRLVRERKSYSSGSKREGVKGTKKSPHFRKGHWHHRWVGSKESRHLELRWQEGTFVNGGSKDKGVVPVRMLDK